MSAAGNEMVQRTPAQQLVARVRQPDFREQVAMALPPSVTPERFVRVATTAILTNDDIAECEPNSVMRALIRCAADGLMPDGKEAAIVKRRNTKLNINEANYMPMIGGFVKIAAEHGWTLKTKAVYENDDFSYTEEPEEIRHTPARPGVDRGALIGAYATATHKDGRKLLRFMHDADIAKRRAMATTQNVWNKWPAEMYEKTPGRDLFADLPLADSDLERERIKRLLSEGELLADPAVSLYGPRIEGTSHEAAIPPADRTLPSSQQAGDVGLSAAAAASPAPDVDPHEEPDIDSAGGFSTPPGVAEDETVIAAQHASQFVIPNGKHRGVALGELLDKDGGQAWLAWALAHISEPPDYVSALFAFSRVYAPELFQAELARRETS